LGLDDARQRIHRRNPASARSSKSSFPSAALWANERLWLTPTRANAR
jgi:hypothetical protein